MRLLTAKDLAKQVGLRPSTIRRWTQEGRLPCLRLSGKVIRYDLAEVEKALNKLAKPVRPRGRVPVVLEASQ